MTKFLLRSFFIISKPLKKTTNRLKVVWLSYFSRKEIYLSIISHCKIIIAIPITNNNNLNPQTSIILMENIIIKIYQIQ